MSVIEHIAEQVGVSHRTVAAVLSGESRPIRRSAMARAARIRKAAEELGYRPSAAARAVRTGLFGQVALLAGTGLSTSTVPLELQWAIVDSLERHDLHLVMTRLDDRDLVDESRLPRVLAEHCCDGLLIAYTHQIPVAMMNIIERHRVPAIWLNTKRDHDCVYHDDVAAGRMATERLLARGHKRIAYADCSYPSDRLEQAHYSTLDREAGYAEAMRAAGLPQRTERIVGSNDAAARARFAERLVRAADRPQAVVAYANSTAESLAWQAVRSGLDLHQDLPMVVIGNGRAEFSGQAMETVQLDQARLGQTAVEALLDKMNHPSRPLSPRVISPTPVLQ